MKVRVCWHSSDDPNCRSQILLVDGDHRVAIYAQKDLAPGTELFYNYGTSFFSHQAIKQTARKTVRTKT